MKTTLKLMTILFATLLLNCGGKEEKKKEGFSYEKKTTTEKPIKKAEVIPASKKIDLKNKGIGPVSSLELAADIDQAMATKGADVFKKMCTACHRSDKKFIGPAPKDILSRRTPEWVMNMILNPDEMTQKDPLAKALLIEFNGSPMANQNLSEEDARAVLEYFRTLK
jgi:cytochrome c